MDRCPAASASRSFGARRTASTYPDSIYYTQSSFSLVPSPPPLETNADHVAASWSPEVGARRRWCCCQRTSPFPPVSSAPLLLHRLPDRGRDDDDDGPDDAAGSPRRRDPPRRLRSRERCARSRFATTTGSVVVLPARPYGGIVDAPGRENNPDAIELARFAVDEHNKRNAALEFVRLVKVRMQLVAGTMNYLTVEVREVDGGGTSKLYEAKVLLRPREKFKRRLEAFEPVADAA